jgi:Resolvase, N terminal domain
MIACVALTSRKWGYFKFGVGVCFKRATAHKGGYVDKKCPLRQGPESSRPGVCPVSPSSLGHQHHVDTTTPSGRALFQMMGVFAEFERAMIRERVNAGLARARAKGKVLGRPKVKPAVEKRIRELRAKGMGMVATARHA